MTSEQKVIQLGGGMHFEDFQVGRRLRSAGRTITEADLCAFVNLTHMNEAVFTDLEYAKAESVMQARTVPGALCYAFAEGLCLVETLQFTGLAFLGMELEMKSSVVVGDTIHVDIDVIETRLSKSNSTRGLVRTRNTVVKQDGNVGLIYTPLRMVRCRAK
jgi:acyl dehydratase